MPLQFAPAPFFRPHERLLLGFSSGILAGLLRVSQNLCEIFDKVTAFPYNNPVIFHRATMTALGDVSGNGSRGAEKEEEKTVNNKEISQAVVARLPRY